MPKVEGMGKYKISSVWKEGNNGLYFIPNRKTEYIETKRFLAQLLNNQAASIAITFHTIAESISLRLISNLFRFS